MPEPRWAVRKQGGDPSALEAGGCPRVLALLLASRGHADPDEARRFLKAGVGALHDPADLNGLSEVAALVLQAVGHGEKICVYGDYDADGVTATALLTLALKSAGAQVFPYIPSREGEGYGLNPAALGKIAGLGAKLVVTVDTGISAVAEAETARELGLKLAVTDHHRPRAELPRADALTDPHIPGCRYPFDGLAGVGVALKLACAVTGSSTREMLERFGDLVCLGTVADVVPLLDENRAMVRMGLRLMEKRPRPGIAALLEAAGAGGRKLTATTLAFTVAPRINACGRMGSARQALELLLTGNSQKAAALAQKLCEINRQRQEVEQEILKQALEQIEEDPELLEAPLLVLSGEGWHNGVIGIVAARLVERFGKPAVLISVENGEGRGSCRSVEGFDIFAALNACGSLLSHYGGHPMAAGFTVAADRVEEFTGALYDYAFSQPEPPEPTLWLDAALRPEELTIATARNVALLEPFGCGNPAPLFLLAGARVERVQPLSGGKHLRLSMTLEGRPFEALLFRAEQYGEPPVPGDLLDCAVQLEPHEYHGKESLSVLIRALRPARQGAENGASANTGAGVKIEQNAAAAGRTARTEAAGAAEPGA